MKMNGLQPCNGSEKSRSDRKKPGPLPTLYSLGIDIGYSSVKVALIDDAERIVYGDYVLHKGKIKETAKNMLSTLSKHYDPALIVYGAVTGSETKQLVQEQGIHHVNEVSALIEGSICIHDAVRSVIEIGGETARYITGFYKQDKSRLEISMNSNCSAGTGSFLEEQVSRLNLAIEDYSVYAARGTNIPRIAGRCSVFAKTDIIHHQQEGVPVEDILLGLAYALVRNYRAAVMKKLPLQKPIFFAGGVARNDAIVHALSDILNLSDGDLIVSDLGSTTAAIGAAVIAKKTNSILRFEKLERILQEEGEVRHPDGFNLTLPCLYQYGLDDYHNKHTCKPLDPGIGTIDCFLGIDVGSTSTNLVLINEHQEIIACQYLKTLGDPVQAVIIGLGDLGNKYDDRVRIVGVGTTGSGRYMIARLTGADSIKDEITAQARAAVAIDDSIDTVFEIGGQDSKYINLKNGVVTDFQMNKICAAGTGSFIEEQSRKFDIPIKKFGEYALSSQNPIYLGERCTVFVGSSIAAHLEDGSSIEDIISGLCYSVVKNYLNRVVGQKEIGDRIFLQGGIAYNQGVVNAFRSLTEKEVIIPPFFSVTGAYGAAILAKEEIGSKKTTFKGFFPDKQIQIQEEKVTTQLHESEPEYDAMVRDLFFEGYDGTRDPGRETIGIPRALFTYGMYPMFHAFFRELGYNVILSDPTSEQTVWLGQDYSLDETCYPIKLINGHVAELVEKNVDYIFFPNLYTVVHPKSHTRRDFGCPYMQLAFKLVNRAMELDKKGITVLAPTIGFSLGEEFMRNSFMNLGKQLKRTPDETERALNLGMKTFHEFETRVEEKGKEAIKNIRPDEKAFVLISKTYGVADPVLNMGIPGRLKKMGYKVLTFYNLPPCTITQNHPNMFWPFGQHILKAAQVVKQHPNLYAIYLSHHGCGPDTVLTHYFREIMEDKPYLNIEVDEHSSDVGVITRLEAFINSLTHIPSEKAGDMESYPALVPDKKIRITTDCANFSKQTYYYIPDLYPYSRLFCEFLKKEGITSKLFSPTSETSIDYGRKHTITNEYFSMTALIGDALQIPDIRENNRIPKVLFIPQSEGAEVEGQYNRVLRTILDEEGLSFIGIKAPYIEDIIYQDRKYYHWVFLLSLAGDIIRLAPLSERVRYLTRMKGIIQRDELNVKALEIIAREISGILQSASFAKTIFAIGEPLILYNDMLQNNILNEIEQKKYRVVYAPLSECLWQTWKDHVLLYGKDKTDILVKKLDVLKDCLIQIHQVFRELSPFEENPDELIRLADSTIGYYAGAFGKYRGAKIAGLSDSVDGIITISSMYENTGILLRTLYNGFEAKNPRPILNLTCDGTVHKTDTSNIDSFLYYL